MRHSARAAAWVGLLFAFVVAHGWVRPKPLLAVPIRPLGAQAAGARLRRRSAARCLPEASVAAPEPTGTADEPTRFDALGLSSESLQALEEGHGFEHPTPIQADTIPLVLKGSDVVGQAATGSGKTLAFLLPIAEHLRGRAGAVGGPIRALVLVPTRELALQIEREAELLLSYHAGAGVCSVYGGVNIKKDQKRLASTPCDLLVATPGRLQEHMDDTDGFWERLQHLKILAVDEADQLLGRNPKKRSKVMERLFEELPLASERQGLLFSATFPDHVASLIDLALREDFQRVEEASEEAPPLHIEQTYAWAKAEDLVGVLWAALRRELEHGGKVMVFFCNIRICRHFVNLFRSAGVDGLVELHARLPQRIRTEAFESFMGATSGVMFTSDASARGLDYPGVSAVLQVGAPTSRTTYVHRIGRTGRGGKPGVGLLLLLDFERSFLERLEDLPLKPVDPAQLVAQHPAPAALLSPAVDRQLAETAYAAWLQHYSRLCRFGLLDQRELLRQASQFAASIGAAGPDGSPPHLPMSQLTKMGLEPWQLSGNAVQK